jgi:hypothetical protein
MNTNKKTARKAGFLYLGYIIFTAIALVVGRKGIIVDGDAATTAANIIAKGMRFRVGFVSDAVAGVLFLLAAWYLYVLLKPVNKNIALLFLLLNLGGFTIWCFSALNLFAGQLLLSGADYLKVFQPGQLQAQAMLFINLYKNGSTIAQIPYGIWLFPLGYLVFKSGFLPKMLGILLIVDCFGLLIYVFQCFLLPGYKVISYPCLVVSFIAKLSLTLWLLIKGIKDQEPALADGQN